MGFFFKMWKLKEVEIMAHFKLDGGKLVQNEMNLDMKEDQSCFSCKIHLSFHHNYDRN